MFRLTRRTNAPSFFSLMAGHHKAHNGLVSLCSTCATICHLIGLMNFSSRFNHYCPTSHIYPLASKYDS